MRSSTIIISVILASSLISCSGGGDSSDGAIKYEDREANLDQPLSAEPWLGAWRFSNEMFLVLSNDAVSKRREARYQPQRGVLGVPIFTFIFLNEDGERCEVQGKGTTWSDSLPSKSFMKASLRFVLKHWDENLEGCITNPTTVAKGHIVGEWYDTEMNLSLTFDSGAPQFPTANSPEDWVGKGSITLEYAY